MKWKIKTGPKNKGDEKKTVMKMIDINPTISLITLIINALNALIIRQRLLELIKTHTHTQDSTTYRLQETHGKYKDI